MTTLIMKSKRTFVRKHALMPNRKKVKVELEMNDEQFDEVVQTLEAFDDGDLPYESADLMLNSILEHTHPSAVRYLLTGMNPYEQNFLTPDDE
jgi:hypothetical protein